MCKGFQINIKEKKVVLTLLPRFGLVGSGLSQDSGFLCYRHCFCLASVKDVIESRHQSPKVPGTPIHLLSPRRNQGVIVSKSRSQNQVSSLLGILCAKIKPLEHNERAMKVASHGQSFKVFIWLDTCLVTADPAISL